MTELNIQGAVLQDMKQKLNEGLSEFGRFGEWFQKSNILVQPSVLLPL